METPRVTALAEPVASRVQVLATTVRIHDLLLSRPAVVAYLKTLAHDKHEAALIHALEVGVAEIVSRRRLTRSET